MMKFAFTCPNPISFDLSQASISECFDATLPRLTRTLLPARFQKSCAVLPSLDLNVVHISLECQSSHGDYDLRGIPHTIKVERKGNELIVHIALTERPSWDRTGVILASEGWQDIGYGLKMQLTIASTNVILQNERIKLIQKPGILNRLRGKKIPMLEDKS